MAKAGIVYAGTADGLVTLSDPGGIGRWRRVAHELRGHAVRAQQAQNALELLVAVAGMGLQQTTDGGQTWQCLLDADVVAITAHPVMPEQIFALTGNGMVQHSNNRGATWHAVLLPEAQHHAAKLIAPYDPQHLYVAQGNVVLASADAGATWSQYGAAFAGAVTELVAAPGPEQWLFAAAEGRIYRTAVGAQAEWQPVALPGDVSARRVALTVLPGKQPVVLAAAATAESFLLLRSADDGVSWQAAQVDTPLNAEVSVIMPASYHMDTVWAGTTAGQLLRSDDRGRTWSEIAREAAAISSLAVVRLA
jgi:photosystem II stability/assembly factor-like uncharacterized protein